MDLWASKLAEPSGSSKRGRYSITYENTLPPTINEPFIVPRKYFADAAIEKAKRCLEEYPCNYRNLDNGGLYSGASGLAYMCFALASAANFEDVKQDMLKAALEVADKTVDYCTRSIEKGDVVSFFYGKGGMFAVSAAIFRTCGKDSKATEFMLRYAQGQTHCSDINYSLTGGNNVSNGRSGYMAGLIWLNQFFTNNEIRLYSLYSLLQATYTSGKNEAEKLRQNTSIPEYKKDSPLMFHYMNIHHLGSLNGLCGILQVFLMCSFFLNENKQVEEDVHKAVDYLLSLQMPDGSFPDKMEEIKIHVDSYETFAQWQTGACGMFFLLAKAYLRWKDKKYLESCILISDFVWKNGLIRKSIGLLTGIAGNCYVFLVMFRLVNDTSYLYKAMQFAQFMISEKCLRNILNKTYGANNPYNLAEGMAGLVVLLKDLVNYSTADYPFLPVFSNIDRLR